MLDNLNAKIRALDDFSSKANLDEEINLQIRNFMSNNYREIFSKVDEDAMIYELPASLREDLFYHQFGNIILKFEFLTNLQIDSAWSIVKNLKKISFFKNDLIYSDNSLSSSMYLIH